MSFKRTKIAGIMAFILLATMCARVGYIMVENGKAYRTMAAHQQKRSVDVKLLRGRILDRAGRSFTDVSEKKQYLSGDGKIKSDKADARFEFVTTKRSPKSAKHIIGYTSGDGNGICGIEKEFDFVLKNQGRHTLSYNADGLGNPVDSFFLLEPERKSQSEVKLTIDKSIQKLTEEIMDKHIKKGAVVVLDCRTFDVVAMCSRPDYDTEKLGSYANSNDGELLNRAVMGYNAGSVFKIVTTSAAIEKDRNYTKRQFDCHGEYYLPDGNVFVCHNSKGHGLIPFGDAFAFSCNCSFYVTGLEVGGDAIMKMARKFGMGETLLNADLGESAGFLPRRDEYTDGEILNLSIGQGEILISPLQCAVMTATIANEGVRKSVNIVDGYTDEEGKYHNLRNNGSLRVISKATAKEISCMMRACVTKGTAKKASASHAAIAGKTGSAESGWVEDAKTLVHGWFCGFFPFESPKYAAVILCEGGQSGAESCVEPFVELAEKINGIYPFLQ